MQRCRIFCRYIPKIKLEILVDDENLQAVTDVVTKTANTGKIGDGKIFITTIDEASELNR